MGYAGDTPFSSYVFMEYAANFLKRICFEERETEGSLLMMRQRDGGGLMEYAGGRRQD